MALRLIYYAMLVLLICRSGTCNTAETTTGNTTTTVRLLTLLSYPSDRYSLQPPWERHSGALQAIQLAVKHVNEDKNILPGYQVELTNGDGGCNTPLNVLTSLSQHVFYGPQAIAGIIGTECSKSTLIVSSLTSRPGIALPTVHFASSSLLEDRDKHPYAYGMLSSSLDFIKASISLRNHNKWEYVAALYDSNIYIHLSQHLRNVISLEFQKNKVVFMSVIYEMHFPLDALINSKARVIIMWTADVTLSRKVLCVAHEKGMMFPHYQWVLPGFHLQELVSEGPYISFSYKKTIYNCTNKEILQDNLLMDYRSENIEKTSQLISGYTYDDVLQHFSGYNKQTRNSLSVYYDAVWALVVALNITAGAFNDPVNVSSLRIGNREFAEEMKHSLDNVKFSGISGEIAFDSTTGFTRRPVDIFHIKESMDAVLVGFFREGNITILTGNSDTFINTTRVVIIETVQLPVALMFFFIILGLFLTTIFLHILSTLKRQHPSIKASSLTLNHFIFFGCYIWTAASVIYIVFLKAVDNESDNDYIWPNCCHAVWVWLIPIGITLIFGTLIAKTWRIYRIFIHFQNPGRLISNRVLTIMILMQVSFDVVFGITWSIVSPARLKLTEILTSTHSNMVTYVIQRSCIFVDKNDERVQQLFWIVILYFYKGIQMVTLFVLTLLTRNIKNKKFTTFLLRKASYVTVLLFLSTLPASTVLWYINAEIHADFVCVSLLLSGSMFICFVFVLLPPASPILKQMCVSSLRRC